MSTRRGGERPEKKEDEEEKERKEKRRKEPEEKKEKKEKKEEKGAVALPSDGAGPSRAPVAEPRAKRPKVEHEEASWGGLPPPPAAGIIPQPLLPIVHVAGQSGDAGFADGPCSSALFNGPTGLGIAADGSLLVSDSDNRRLRKVSVMYVKPEAVRAEGASWASCVSYGAVSTIVGNGDPGIREGRGNISALVDPQGIVSTKEGVTFITDAGSHTVRRVAPNGEITLLAGNGNPGFQDGTGLQAAFDHPYAASTRTALAAARAYTRSFVSIGVFFARLGTARTFPPLRAPSHCPPPPSQCAVSSLGPPPPPPPVRPSTTPQLRLVARACAAAAGTASRSAATARSTWRIRETIGSAR